MGRKMEQKLVAVAGEATGTLNTDFGVGETRNFSAFLDVTASTGSSETLDIKFQEWDVGAEKGRDIASAAFAQAGGVTAETIAFVTNALRLRAVRVVAGSTPTFDYTLGIAGAP